MSTQPELHGRVSGTCNVHAGSVHVFKTPHHERLRRDWRIAMVDVATATAAAPTYFPAARVDGHRLIDGGVWANNPSVVGIAEAVSMLGAPLSVLRVLNIGTTDHVSHHPRSLDTGGLARWARHAVPLVVTASSRGTQGTAEHLVGKERYSRFDAIVPGGLYALDAADAADLASHASSASRQLSPVFTARFADHQAGRYEPLTWPTNGDSLGPSTTIHATTPENATDATR